MTTLPNPPAMIDIRSDAEKNMKPIHEHDCDCCIFLGNSKDGKTDLYYHNSAAEETVIARFGSDGDYYFGMCFVGRQPYLTEAYELAKQRNLL